MRHLPACFVTVFAALPAWAGAQELGRVLSSTPVIQQVAVPREVCTQQQVTTPRETSGGGAVLGAVAGGAVGNAIGDGSGRAAATVLGVIGGAMLGDRIERGGATESRTVQHCQTQTFYENRTVAYQVVYEYAGRQYSVQLPYDPGTHVRLQVTPVATPPTAVPVQPVPVQPAPQAQPLTQAPVVMQAPVISSVTTVVPWTQPVVVMPPVVLAPPVVVHRPWAPPPGLHISVGHQRPPRPHPYVHAPPPGGWAGGWHRPPAVIYGHSPGWGRPY